jgi:hypothetical protein
MLLKDIFKNALKTDANSHYPHIEEFSSALGMPHICWDNRFAERVKGYWVAPWYCTDEYVGMAVYFLDDKPLAVSIQTGRKSSAEYEFYSHEAAKACINFILELQGETEYNYSVANLEEDHKQNIYHVSCGSQLLTDVGYYNGDKVKVVETFQKMDEVSNWSFVVVENETGEKIKISLKEFDIPYRLS